MPEDLPKAVLVLVWLLGGTIMFGALLMHASVLGSVVFALLFFGLPVACLWLACGLPASEKEESAVEKSFRRKGGECAML